MQGEAVTYYTDFGTDVETSTGDTDSDLSDWYCIRTDPFPAPECGCNVEHVTAPVIIAGRRFHMIVIWPERDHPTILEVAQQCKSAGRNPRIIECDVKEHETITYGQWSKAWDAGELAY